MILLDTHVLIWLAEGSNELKPQVRKTLDEAAYGSGLGVSSISFWEVAMLSARGRIILSQPVSEWRSRILAQDCISEVPITGGVSIESVLLPGTLHPDPADRLMVATCRLNGWSLATRDIRLLAYGAQGYLKTLAI
jgi:PIN domain nuclease of toxin-antitoxin system